jgi:hypothetical protein
MKNVPDDTVRVLTVQQRATLSETRDAHALAARIERDIRDVEQMLAKRGAKPAKRSETPVVGLDLIPPVLRPWDELAAEARGAEPGEPTFADLFTLDEMEAATARLSQWNKDFRDIYRMRARDYAVAGVAGVLAGLVDVVLVQVPARAGMLGGLPVQGGWLSNTLKAGFGNLLPADTIRRLEKDFPVVYDPATNRGLVDAVQGLGPRSHRLQSLGHDPLIGWFFGVRDILDGTFTAIGSDGSWIRQAIGTTPDAAGVNILTRVIEAFVAVGGHMLSDVATPAGLPPPLFGLLQMINTGNIGGRTVGELARAMYASGYDFRHYLAGGVGVALIECIVRFAWMAGELAEGKSLNQSLPIGRKPRLQSSLLLAHSIAAGVNAGKVAITNNPLSINTAQWMALARYALPQIHWALVGKDAARSTYVDGQIDADFFALQSAMTETWRLSFASTIL